MRLPRDLTGAELVRHLALWVIGKLAKRAVMSA